MSLWDTFKGIVDGVENSANTVFNIAGNALGGAIEDIPGATMGLENLVRATNEVAAGASWGVSAAPGGISTMSWEKAHTTSPGQTALANAFAPNMPGGWVQNRILDAAEALSPYPAAAAFERQRLQRAYIPWTVPGFDVTDEADQRLMNESPVGKMYSGTTDAVFDWYADGGAILGKAAKVARTGTKVGSKSFMGLTTRTIRTAEDVQKLSAEIDEFVLFRQSGGVAGRETPLGIAVERTLDKDAAAMLFDPFASKSTNPGLVAALLGESKDIAQSALVVKAGIGDTTAMNILRQQSASTADALERALRLDASMAQSFSKPIGELGDDLWVKRPQDVERLDQITADLVAKDSFLQRALELEDRPVLSQVGSVSKNIESARAVWYAQRAESRLDTRRVASQTALEEFGPQWVERVYQRNPYVRPVRVLARSANWVQGKKPAGWIGLKGDLYNDSTDELFAALTDSPTLARTATDVEFKRQVLNDYMAAPTVTARMNAVTTLERQAAQRIADAHGIPRALSDELYASYKRSRETATEFLSNRGYLIDTDGSIIKSPVLSSQLADSLPMMDFRVYEDLIRRHKSALVRVKGNTGDLVRSVLEPIYTAWKASVLFRMGYTIRNLAEGNARAVAAYGFIPAFADPWGSMRRFAGNDARREAMARNYVYELAKRNSPKTIRKQIDMLRDAQDAAERQLQQIRVESDLVRVSEARAASGVDNLTRDDYYASHATNGELFDIGDLEMSIGSASASLLPTRQRAQFLALNAREQGGEILTGADIVAYRHLRAKAARTRLRELQASGKDVVALRDGKPVLVVNVRELTDEDLVPLANTRKGSPAAAVESGDIPLSSSGVAVRAGARKQADVYVMDSWLQNVRRANNMRETVPGRVAKAARVKNPKPVNSRDYYLDEVTQRQALSAIDDIAELEETLSTLYGRLEAAGARRTAFGARKRLGDTDVFDGTQGSIARVNASADATYENFVQGQMSRYEIQQQKLTNSWGPISPGDTRYFDELSHVASFQFKNDRVATMALAGDRSRDAVAWLKSAEGRTYRREMDLSSSDIDAHVAQVYDMVHSYIPDPDLRRRIADGDVSPLDMQVALKDYDLAEIHGRQVAAITMGGAEAGKIARAGITKMYRLIGSAPEDLAARHPFYRQMHIAEQSRLTALAAGQGKQFTPEVLERIKAQAHSFALKELKRTLYTLDRYSNPAMVLRWIMPFFPAYENTIKTWLRIGYEDPSVIARASMIWNAPNKAGMVVDEDGNELPAGAPFSQSSYVVLPEPLAKAISKFVPGGQVPDLPKGSANFILPGDSPFLPGLSFLMSTPVQMWIAADPMREDNIKSTLASFFGEHGADQIYRQFVPFGVATGDAASSTLSTSLKQLGIRMGGEGNADFMMRALGIYRDMLNAANAEGAPYPSAEEAIKKAYAFSDLRLAAAVVQPFALRWRSPYQMYIDEYRRLITDNGFVEGEKLFDAKYPEYVVLKQSLSSNPTGMSADMQAYKTYQANTGLWNRVTGIDPKFGQFVTNPVSRGEFNGTVYRWQSGKPIRPGMSDTIHGRQDIESFEKAANVSKGWDDYQSAKAKMDNWLAENGLTSLQDKGAEYARMTWNAWLSKQESVNPDWFTERQKYMNNAGVRQTVTALTVITSDEKFMSTSPDKDMWLLVSDYLDKRDVMVQALEQRDADGGSKSLDANSNEDAAAMWAAYVEKVRGANTDFAAFYDRWLDGDDLTRVTVSQ